MKKKLFILSTKAGKEDFQKFKKDITQVYKNHNKLDELDVILTEHKTHAKDAAKDFLSENPKDKIVIVCGGDGTLGEVSNIVAKTDGAMGLIPMGTANDFSKNFDYKNFKIEDTFDPIIKPIDIMEVNNNKCINVCSLGFDTHVLEKTYEILEKNPDLGNKAFLKAVYKSISNIKFEDLELDLVLANGENYKTSGEFVVSAICNGSYYGSGFNPAPNGKLDDGLLNIITAKKQPVIKLIPLIARYKFGKHLSHKAVNEYIVKSGKIKSINKLTANLDGEIFYDYEIDFKVIENGLNWAYFKAQ